MISKIVFKKELKLEFMNMKSINSDDNILNGGLIELIHNSIDTSNNLYNKK